jgi:N-hydroxyarylamine O-acetyltransferase
MTLDLPAYLQRIGVTGVRQADLATLRRIALRHPLSIPFENLNAFGGVRVSLALADVQRKLVRQSRGGWCFEHNLLLGEALRALGFSVRDFSARVLWKRDVTDQTPRTHRLLEVQCEGRRWLVDGGFGRQTLTGILDLDDRQAQATPHEYFRLRELDGDLLLEAQPTGVKTDIAPWYPLYRFDQIGHWPVDFEAANYQLAHDPQSHFVTDVMAARVTETGRWTLHNRELTWRGLNGEARREQLADAPALHRALREHFGIEAAGLAGLDEKFSRLGGA